MLQTHEDMPLIFAGRQLRIRAIDKELLQRYPYGTVNSCAIKLTSKPTRLQSKMYAMILVCRGEYYDVTAFRNSARNIINANH